MILKKLNSSVTIPRPDDRLFPTFFQEVAGMSPPTTSDVGAPPMPIHQIARLPLVEAIASSGDRRIRDRLDGDDRASDAATSRIANAAAYPVRPVRIVVGFAPGGGADLAGRLLAQALSERMDQQFFVENRPGAGANIAMDAVAKSAPDGYTLLVVSPGAAINPSLYEKLSYNVGRDFTLISGFLRVPNVMVANQSVPTASLADFIAYAKAKPGKINMASAGVGSSVHLSGELFKFMAGLDLTHVPYRGAGPMLTDLLGGQVQVAFPDIGSSLQHVRSGKLRALAVTTGGRSAALPERTRLRGKQLVGYRGSDFG